MIYISQQYGCKYEKYKKIFQGIEEIFKNIKIIVEKISSKL